MDRAPDFLVASPTDDGIAAALPRAAIRAVVSSLARGGAERIVLDWLGAERRRGRAVELAVLHARRHEYPLPDGLAVIRRAGVTAQAFVSALGTRWTGSAAPVSTHLVGDELLALLWERGVRTVPVIHNVREGWRNDPASWPAGHVPFAVACAEAVRRQVLEAGCAVPVATLRHRPTVGAAATDRLQRGRLRAEWGIPPEAFVVLAVGAIKPQKDHPRALEALAELRRGGREAFLVILGGVLDAAGLAELDRLAAAAARAGVAHALRLPGFVDPVEPWYAAADALLNASRHEGLSMATAEALAAGLPVVATDVGGQREIGHGKLVLLAPDSPPQAFARALAGLPVRTALEADPAPGHPRAWSMGVSWHRRAGAAMDTLFVTANLNAGGAQRSLVNLAHANRRAPPLRDRGLRQKHASGVSRTAREGRRRALPPGAHGRLLRRGRRHPRARDGERRPHPVLLERGPAREAARRALRSRGASPRRRESRRLCLRGARRHRRPRGNARVRGRGLLPAPRRPGDQVPRPRPPAVPPRGGHSQRRGLARAAARNCPAPRASS